MKKRRVVVNDKMQRGYVYYRTESVGRNFAPGFTPDLTPSQMLRLGVFGGKYMTDCRQEFSASWFAHAKLSPERRNAKLNFFKVNASQRLAEWRRKGWIRPLDPRGWFQWYCRYYMGRRSADDARQIRRWRAIRRHVTQIQGNAKKAIATAAAGSGRLCCTGRTTVGRSEISCWLFPAPAGRRNEPLRGAQGLNLGRRTRFAPLRRQAESR